MRAEARVDVVDRSTTEPGVRRLLRVGLIVESLTQPQWVHKAVAGISRSAVTDIVLIVKYRDARPGRVNIVTRLIRDRHRLVYMTLERLDAFLSKAQSDAFKPVSIEGLVSGHPIIHVAAEKTGHGFGLTDESIDAILTYDLDVAILLSARRLEGRALTIASNGVWFYHPAEGLGHDRGAYGFQDAIDGNVVMGPTLEVLTAEGSKAVLYGSCGANASRVSVSRNTNPSYWKSSEFAGRKLRELYDSGSVEVDHTGSDSEDFRNGERPERGPANFQAASLLPKLAVQFFVPRATELLWRDQWSLAYRMGGDTPMTAVAGDGFTQLIPPKDRAWADPFPLKRGDDYFVFIEELPFAERKGHISVLRIDADGSVTGPVKVLERPYHLSYPFVFRWKDELYMIPETYQNRTIELYRCVEFPHSWEFVRVLVSDVVAVDATLTQADGLWWMFVNIGVDGAGTYDELHLFYSESPLEGWTPHPRNPVRSDARSARPAGNLFRCRGDLYRPAQDCGKRYGYAISLNKVTRMDTLDYHEQEVSKILPDWTDGLLATHTIQCIPGLTVVDGLIRRRKLL